MRLRNLIIAAGALCAVATDAASADNFTITTGVFAVKDRDTLAVDILQPLKPVAGDTVARPVVLFLSGGGWEGQARRTAITETYPLLPYFVDKGYVGVAADYRCDFGRARKSGRIADKSIGEFVAEGRLADKGVTDAIGRAVDMAVDDLFDVTRYLLDNAARFGIDPARIIVVGSSAGAITALTAEHALCNGKARKRLPDGFNYAAVIPMAGGIWCADNGDTLQWKHKPCPVLMFHGDADPIVSYRTLHVDGRRWSMNGVSDIAAQLGRMGVPHTLYTYSGMNHDAAVVPMNTKLDYMANFLRQTVLQPGREVRLSAVATQWPAGEGFPDGRNAMKGVVRTTYRFKTVDSDTLLLDVFEAPEVPSAMAGNRRPVFFYDYGGGWQAGSRHDMVSDRLDLCPYFARHGWTAVCFDYRLGFLRARQSGRIEDKCILQYIAAGEFADPKVWGAVQDAIDMAVDDTVDALAFLADNAAGWGADTARVVGMGGSAGAINLLTLENRKCNGTHPQQTSRLPRGFNFAALAPMAGGVWRTATDSLRWNSRPCPMLLFHGDADPVVPYDKVEFPASKASMWGSKQIARQLWQMGVPCALYTVAGGDHAWSANPVIFNRPDVEHFVRRVLDYKEPLQLDIHQNTPGLNRDGYWFARYMAGQEDPHGL